MWKNSIQLAVLILATALFFSIASAYQDAPVEIISSNLSETILEINIEEPAVTPVVVDGSVFHRIDIPKTKTLSNHGEPAIPFISAFLAISDFGSPNCEILDIDDYYMTNIIPVPYQDEDLEDIYKSDGAYQGNAPFPGEIVTTGAPVIFRDFRLTMLTFYPVQYDPQREEIRIIKRVRVRISVHGAGDNPKTSNRLAISSAFLPLYQNVITNFNHVAYARPVQLGRYLLITRDSFNAEVLQLYNWKKRMGFDPVLVNLYEDIGYGSLPTSRDIKAYIRNAYLNWEVPPDYVVLVGDVEMGTYGAFPDYPYYSYFEGDEFPSDFKYTLLEGDDYFPEVMIGRISVDNPGEAHTAISKITKYEREPYMDETDWYIKGVSIAANCCGTPQPVTPRLTALWNRELFLEHGFTEVDTVFCYGYTSCTHTSSQISAIFNEGLSIISYRGWASSLGWTYPNYGVSNIMGLSNGWKLPVMTSIVCGTGNFNHSTTDPCFGEAWIRAGSPSSPKGGVAFYGASDPFTHTKWNNPNDEGFYWALFKFAETATIGQCVANAKMNIFKSFPDRTDTTDGVPHYFHVYNILGDPSTPIWTEIPHTLTVSHPAEILIGQNSFDITVEREGAPLKNALVCLYATESVQIHGFTDDTGFINFTLNTTSLTTSDSMLITVTKHNCHPYLATLPVSEGLGVLSVSDLVIDDSHPGNGDGMINPGEGVRLEVQLQPHGSGLPEVVARLFSRNPAVTVEDTLNEYGDILTEDDTTWGDGDYSFDVDYTVEAGEIIRLELEIITGPHIKDTCNINLEVYAPKLEFVSLSESSGDGIFSPGEEVNLEVSLANTGNFAASSLEGVLSAETSFGITILDGEASFPGINPADTMSNYGSFTFSISGEYEEGVYEMLLLNLTADWFRDEFKIPILIGNAVSTAYTGPDNYGYYCYDNYDEGFHRARSYNWAEIDTAYGGSGTYVYMEEETNITVGLPFTFQYYGHSYDSVTICENGWLSFGRTTAVDFYNRNIPNPSCAPAQVSAFWDDLSPGSVFYMSDPANHRFIVEWSRMEGRYDSIQTFEAILYDPEYYETPTGDGEILVQYKAVVNNDDVNEFATVGIESPDQEDGLEYTYCNFYPYSARELEPGLALLFTTNTPMMAVDEAPKLPESYEFIKCYPNPFNSTVSIEIALTADVQANQVQLEIYDLNGKLVHSFDNGNRRPVTDHWSPITEFTWTPEDNLSSGIYFIRLTDGKNTVITSRVLLLR
ncbi:T9SS type A sorting domain-containing protein [bacterium]|nr:T9SS type A sorting domain-containing protein [bacterium]